MYTHTAHSSFADQISRFRGALSGRRALVVAPTALTLLHARKCFKVLGADVVGETSLVSEALEIAETARPDVVFVAPGLSADCVTDMIRRIREHAPNAFVTVCSDSGDERFRSEAAHCGASHCITGPIFADELVPTLADRYNACMNQPN